METADESEQCEEIETAWNKLAELTPGTEQNRLALGQAFRNLRFLYSDRNSGGHRLTSGHGTFEAEIRKRTKFSPRAARDMIADYEAILKGEPSTSAKRKGRRTLPAPAEPMLEFAKLLPYEAAHAAYRAAAMQFHPDHRGGSVRKMAQLNAAWDMVKERFYRVATGNTR